jgi:hypothetical protein
VSPVKYELGFYIPEDDIPQSMMCYKPVTVDCMQETDLLVTCASFLQIVSELHEFCFVYIKIKVWTIIWYIDWFIDFSYSK